MGTCFWKNVFGFTDCSNQTVGKIIWSSSSVAFSFLLRTFLSKPTLSCILLFTSGMNPVFLGLDKMNRKIFEILWVFFEPFQRIHFHEIELMRCFVWHNTFEIAYQTWISCQEMRLRRKNRRADTLYNFCTFCHVDDSMLWAFPVNTVAAILWDVVNRFPGVGVGLVYPSSGSGRLDELELEWPTSRVKENIQIFRFFDIWWNGETIRSYVRITIISVSNYSLT